MSGILFFIFASCHPLSRKSLLNTIHLKTKENKGKEVCERQMCPIETKKSMFCAQSQKYQHFFGKKYDYLEGSCLRNILVGQAVLQLLIKSCKILI